MPKAASYAGGNIANSVAGGIKYPAGGVSPPVVPVYQPAIGLYVQDALFPAADTNYIGVNSKLGYVDNVLGEGSTNPFLTSAPQPDWTAPVDDNVATGGLAQWVKNGVTPLVPGDKVDIAAGLATKNIATGLFNVFATVPAGGFFWAVTVA